MEDLRIGLSAEKHLNEIIQSPPKKPNKITYDRKSVFTLPGLSKRHREIIWLVLLPD
jgi:hypothetical protein